jgi:hypothetical protein
VYWTNHTMKWRADRLIREIDAIKAGSHANPTRAGQQLNHLHTRVRELFKDGRINKEGFDRLMESIKGCHVHLQACREGGSGVYHGHLLNQACSAARSGDAHEEPQRRFRDPLDP